MLAGRDLFDVPKTQPSLKGVPSLVETLTSYHQVFLLENVGIWLVDCSRNDEISNDADWDRDDCTYDIHPSETGVNKNLDASG